MSVHTLSVAASGLPFQGGTFNDYYNNFGLFTFNGDLDSGVCLQVSGDGKDITEAMPVLGLAPYQCYFSDDSIIPITATINNIQLIVRAKATNCAVAYILNTIGPFYNGGFTFVEGGFTTGISSVYTSLVSELSIINPVTSLPWTRADLFSDGDIGFNEHGAFGFNIQQLSAPATFDCDYMGLIVDYTFFSGIPPAPLAVSPAVGSTLGGD